MGSPLKQLYALRFPHMYKWITLDEQADRPTGDLLGVRKWSNDYRSGDYVGRATWRQNDQDPTTYDPERYDNTGTMMERCIGPGAHTHYWDDSADVIGAELDAIVTEAIHSL